MTELARLTWSEAEQALSRARLALLPVGRALEFARRLAERPLPEGAGGREGA